MRIKTGKGRINFQVKLNNFGKILAFCLISLYQTLIRFFRLHPALTSADARVQGVSKCILGAKGLS
jgi:hypothetical protein